MLYVQLSFFCLVYLIICVLVSLTCSMSHVWYCGRHVSDVFGTIVFKCIFMVILTTGVTGGVTKWGYIFEKVGLHI